MSDTMTEDFAGYVATERERLTRYREGYLKQRADIDRELANINREFAAITAYETAKRGKQPKASGQPRTRRSGLRDGILDVIANAPDGVGRGDIIDLLGIKGDKRGEQSVSNALNALTKCGRAYRADGKYFAVTADEALPVAAE